MSSIEETLVLCEERIGYQFRDRALLKRCLTHSSSAETRLDCNERLEFLGDAVLGLVICEHLFQTFPEQREGNLTQMKSSLVSRQTCARVARQLDLEPVILVGRGLQHIPESILSAVVESIIAGVYFDGGIEAARTFIINAFSEELSLCGPIDTENFKSRLQEHTQRVLGKTPEYILVEEIGPDHAREFCIAARVGSELYDSGRGRSKKEAEQQAARNAILSLMRASFTDADICDEDQDLDFESAEIAGESDDLQTDDRTYFRSPGNGSPCDDAFDSNPATEQAADVCDDFGAGCQLADSSESPRQHITAEYDEVTVETADELSVVPCSLKAGSYFEPQLEVETMSIKTTVCDILYRPESAALRFLPEGPYTCGREMVSWVGIQHGADSTTGSVNLLNLSTQQNRSFDLPGRPGFAFPTQRPGVFITGVERTVGLFDTATQQWTPLVENVDADVSNTIINDAVVFEGNLIFGCKELEFKTRKAGLYLWRSSDRALIRLRNDQICSNGKAIVRNSDGSLTLYDIDSCTKQIVRSPIDLAAGTVGEQEVVVDLTGEEVFPDGMILTPDHKSLIVALYDPGDPAAGAARQYSLATGELEAVWTCPGSPRVTCPQLIQTTTGVKLLLTSAIEHMSAEQQANHPNAGCLFVGETSFDAIGDQPVFVLS